MTSLCVSSTRTTFATATLAAFLSFTALTSSALSASDIFAPGQPVITGFPGVIALDEMPDGADPLDYTFIDPDGQSLSIQELQPDASPEGQAIETPEIFGVTAADVGLVFGVALDDAPETTGADAPNIYLSATSAFGLYLTMPDADGNPMRTRTGDPAAEYMPGQWGSADGATGYPGSIWKIDGVTGEASLFTTIAANSGPGLGDLVFDSSSQQFFVSDLDTGLIYRLALDGTILDTFDHGITARPEHDLDPVEDDGLVMDIADPAFNSEDPSTWGATQPERRVYGLAAQNGRIYYAVRDALSVWSVRLNEDGSFGTPRWEFDVTDLPSANDITSIVFDPQGRMILAQRGDTVGSYDYSVLAAAGTSSVVRFKREFPDDPLTPSTWVATPDSYAIGLASDGLAASGGLALGNGFEDDTGGFTGACGVYVWATGDQLRNNPDLDPPVEGSMYVSGLQGTLKTLVRPLNDPPTNSFFTDFDGNSEDDTATEAGHVGKVAIWQDCSTPTVPDVEPPDFVMPPDFDIDFDTDEFNLTLEKWSAPHTCFNGATDYWCTFTIRVENTGTTAYWGPVTVHDSLPANPAGASMSFWPGSWNCAPAGPTAYTCNTGPVLLFPGEAVTLHEVVKLPKPTAAGFCNLFNVAGIQWPFVFHDENPGDDFDGAVAKIPAPGCVPPGAGVTDLSINKFAAGPNCFDPGGGADYLCTYGIIVTNAGPNNYTGPIQVKDTLGVNVTANAFGGWTCGQVGSVLTCNINAAPVNVPPGWSSLLVIQAKMPKPVAPPACDLDNKAQISIPPGGAPNNILPGNDFDTAVTHILSPACLAPAADTDLSVTKTADTCGWFIAYYCKWTLTFKNVGTTNYWGPLTFTDQAIGAVGNTLTSVLGGCAGAPSNLTCDYGLAALPAGVPIPFTYYTWYNTTPDLCSVSNSVTIDNPNPGSVQNPAGNDSVNVAHSIPNPACAGLPNVNITKTAKGCIDDPGSIYWLCKFDIKVKNFGPVAQPGPIVVRDWNSKPTTFNTGACLPFAVNTWQCTRAAALGPGATWSFQATTQVDPNGVTLADCNVVNTVAIITPPSLANPGHWSQDSQKVPQLFINLGPGPVYVYCDPPSLKLEKTATKTVESGDGYDATFRIKVTSTGPDPYHGTVEIDEDLPDGTTYVSSSWPCVPTTDNNVHCSSPYKDLPVGTYTTMTITIHIPEDVAKESKCEVVNVANIALSAEVLHSDEGVQYTASAAAKLPASLCRDEEPPPQCPINQVMPDGGCCPEGEVWNGKQCAPPKPVCPDDSHLNSAGKCVCDEGTTGKPGSCEEEEVTPVCPDDSHLNNAGKCVCDRGTEGKPGKCEPIDVEPVCPDDSHLNNAGKCVCDRGTEGKPGNCQPIDVEPVCPDDSHLNSDGRCVCDRGTEGKPGSCEPIVEEPTCPPDSHLNNAGKCVCDRGTEGKPGNCQPIIILPICPDDSVLTASGQCVCKRGTTGEPGNCQAPQQPDEIVTTKCPDDSFFNKRTGQCQCNKGTVGEPGQCIIELQLDLPKIF
jgi:hypothetical protein